MSSHEKGRLVRGVELEKRRYIGFARTPVIDTRDHLPTVPQPSDRDELQEPGPLFQPERRVFITSEREP